MPRAKAEPIKRRNAEATRAAILASARKAFAAHGYDGAGVREIAAGAGVTAMLVNRYFGSKEELFAEVAADTMAAPVILSAENLSSPDLAKTFANALVGVTRTGATPLDGFQIMLRSAANPRAAKISRDQIGKHHLRTMTEALRGRHAAERAALMMALVAGVQLMRQTIELKPLAKAEPEVLAALLTPMIQMILDGG